MKVSKDKWFKNLGQTTVKVMKTKETIFFLSLSVCVTENGYHVSVHIKREVCEGHDQTETCAQSRVDDRT